MMKTFKYICTFLILLSALTASAQEYLGICSLLSNNIKEATFETAGSSTKKGDIESNAIKSLFNSLFYSGIEGVCNGQPLVIKENKMFTNAFFNEQAKYTFYIAQTSLKDKVEKVGNSYRGEYVVVIRLSKLLADLKANKIYYDTSSPESMSASDVAHHDNMVLPTIIVVPYRNGHETYAEILQNDYDRRVAVNVVQHGFEERDITTVDFINKLNAVKRRADYDKNSGAAQSSDRQILQSSGADIFVEVEIMKDIKEEGSRVNLTLKAYETASGNIVANKVATTQRRYKTLETDVLCQYTVEDNMEDFMNQIMKNFAPSRGTRVVLHVVIDANATFTMNDPAGKNNYSLSNVIRQWVRKNAFEGKFHLQGMTDDMMEFDYVNIPPIDEDGLRMDAAQFSFLLESYLKEEQNIPCSAKLDGNTIIITIL